MQTHFEKELTDLRESILTMASHAETSVRNAVQSLMARDESLALKVRQDEDIIDRFEVQVDEMSIHLLAKAPLATNLRLIAVAMKISQNLERVGDEASKIAKRALELMREAPLKETAEIPELADRALDMLKRALDCFVNSDPVAARALVPKDKEIDALNRKIYRELANLMAADAETIPRCLNLMVVAKSLERIADHGKNIAEEVVYLCEALDIRHAGKSAPPQP